MSNTKHTPGPWTFGQTLNQGLAVWHSKVGGPDYVIAMHHGSGDQAYADVRLISAAPELLKALQQILSSAPITGLPLALEKDISHACNVVAKATRDV